MLEKALRVVFVHGACVQDGDWWWGPAAQVLAQQGIMSEAPLLPSCGEAGLQPDMAGPGLAEDVDAVRRVLQRSEEATVVVAHSYGGIVAAEAAANVGAVQHLLLVSSYLPEIGESLSSFGGEEPAPFLNVDMANGTFTVRTEALVATFLQDCSEDIQQQASTKLAQQSLSVLAQPVRAAAWQMIPNTYVVCAADNGTPPEMQRRFAQRARRVVEVKSGHHPFLSQPTAVSDLILTL